MMSLRTFTTPPLPPGTPPLPPLNANTHAGVLLTLALSNLASSQNAKIGNLVDKCFTMLPEMDALGDCKILWERGTADQTNSGPLFPMGLSMKLTSGGGWHCQRHCFGRCRGEGAFFPHCRCQHNVHIIVILIVINIFFSSFNDVDLLRSMTADCCMPWCQEWGTMAAVGGLRPPWLACVYFA